MKRHFPIMILLSTLWMSSLAQIAGESLAWPTPALPKDATPSAVGDDMSINGVPVRIFQFETAQSPEAVIAAFRTQVEQNFTRAPEHAALRGSTTVGGRIGDYWVTLQLKSERGRTHGTWAATPRYIPNIKRPTVQPAGFPASARLIQQVDSFDAGRSSQVAMGIDPSPIDGVALRIEENLRELGFAKQSLPRVNWPAPDRYIAVFSKAREEIWVTLQQDRAGTAVTVNRLSALEVLK